MDGTSNLDLMDYEFSESVQVGTEEYPDPDNFAVVRPWITREQLDHPTQNTPESGRTVDRLVHRLLQSAAGSLGDSSTEQSDIPESEELDYRDVIGPQGYGIYPTGASSESEFDEEEEAGDG